MPIGKIVKLIVLWINRYSSTQIESEINCSPTTIVDYRNFFRELCIKIEKRYGMIGGGDEEIVELDEIAVHSRKYGRRDKERELTRILGGRRRLTKNVFALITPTRSSKTMIPIIREKVHSQSIIHSDLSKAYVLSKDGEVIHTNNIESFWQRLKKPLVMANGTSEQLLPSYISESVVRENEKDNFGEMIIEESREFRSG
uniref:DDE_Tnp_IS1595 domain-containing protein n=1 Tax=Caenorhabditis japonica TaxID=281687 RepID=A0A8R1HPT0_CAEJA